MDEQQKYEWIRLFANGKTPEEAAQAEGVTKEEACKIWEECRSDAEQLAAAAAGDTSENLSDDTSGQPVQAEEAAFDTNGIFGIDVSYYQGALNFEKVKSAGCRFVIARAGYGNNHLDKCFSRYASACNQLGIPLGVYWFSYALTAEGARKEADACLAAVRPYRLEYPVFYDLEYASVAYAKSRHVTIDQKLATQMALAFCKEIKKAGYYAANYCNKDYAGRMFGKEVFEQFDFWYASYRSMCDRKDAGIWQYSQNGRIDGKTVDFDRSLKNYPALIKKAGLNGL